MIDLTKLKLPDSVEVDGSFYLIKTDHPYWFRFAELLENPEATYSDFDFLFLNEKPEDKKKGFDALLDFYYKKRELPRNVEESGGARILDYRIDSDLIFASLYECYKIDITEKPMHWHKMQALLSAIHGTRLNEIMAYRAYYGKDKDMLKLKRMWALPTKEDAHADEVLEEFNKEFD